MHKLRTTKIVVEEAASSPEICGTYTFSSKSQKSEISVEEVGSFSMNAGTAESVSCKQEGATLNAVIEETVQRDDLVGRKMSRAISVVPVSEDEKSVAEEKDDEMDNLMERIRRQRSALDDIINHEPSAVEEKEVKTESKAPEVSTVQVEKEPEVEEEEESEEEDIIKEPLEDSLKNLKKAPVEETSPAEEKAQPKAPQKAQEVELKEEAKQVEEVKQKVVKQEKPQPEGTTSNKLISLPSSKTGMKSAENEFTDFTHFLFHTSKSFFVSASKASKASLNPLFTKCLTNPCFCVSIAC